jgi:hypothetical protein
VIKDAYVFGTLSLRCITGFLDLVCEGFEFRSVDFCIEK